MSVSSYDDVENVETEAATTKPTKEMAFGDVAKDLGGLGGGNPMAMITKSLYKV